MEEELDLKFIKENVSSISQARRETHKFHEIYYKVIDKTKFLDLSYGKIPFTIRVTALLAGIQETPLCACCMKPTSFTNNEFNTYCSKECRQGIQKDKELYENYLDNYDWLYEHRVTKRMSHSEIGKLIGVSEFPVRNALKRFQLNEEKYNESSSYAKSKLRDKEWLLQQHKELHKKCSDIAEELNVSKSTVSVYLAKHGIESNPVNSYTRDASKESKGHREIKEFVESLGFTTINNERQTLNGYEIDILIPEKNIGIEYHGLYSHVYRPHETEYAKRKDDTYHRIKYELALEKGVHLLQIYSDLWDDKREIVKDIIQSKLGITERIYARKCEIRTLSNSMKNIFLEENHIQGQDKTSIRFGLFHEDKLVAVMTFNKSRRGNKLKKQFEWELCRYCSLNGVTVVGGFSKLLKHFRKNFSGGVISYSDCMWSVGGAYEKNGFTLLHEAKPNYYYVSPCYTKRFHRSNFQKKKIAKDGDTRTEEEIMFDMNYSKIFDAGMKVWVIHP